MIRGVLGGSFDPVHAGHVAMARFALERGLVQRLHVVPARISPHKATPSAAAEHRLAMVRLAFAGLPEVIIDERELQRPGPSFTVDTLSELAHQFPGDTFLLIIGQDNLEGLDDWKEPARIGALARVAVLARRPETEAEPAPKSEQTQAMFPGLDLAFYEDFHQPVSSSSIRAILAGNPSHLDELVRFLPVAVAEYIIRNGLYRG
jgi:nicotinate-nucleotide adenylyltransferase